MEVHIFFVSTMTAVDTMANLEAYGFTFDCQEGTIQKFKWIRDDRAAVSVSLWVSRLHPLLEHLASSLVPYMDACVCWYHDHDGLSCLQVQQAMNLLQRLRTNVRLVAATTPLKHERHESRIRRYYDQHGFEIERLIGTLDTIIEEILRVHLDIQKSL